MTLKVTLFGTGYVGLVTGTCLAEMGNHVLCVDVDAAKVARLKQGEVPIYEPGLAPMVQRNHASGRLDFTTEAAAGIARCTVRSVPSVPPSLRRSDADWLIRRNPGPNGVPAGTAHSRAATGSHLTGTTSAAA
jgi:UDP-glucose 6-dehydrogenase